MNVMELQRALRQLRLGGMAVVLEARLHQAQAEPRAMPTIADLLNDEVKSERMAIFGLVMVAPSVVLLSAAGIYALMSFTVTRRHREIGIRMALGARRGRVLAGILQRALRQIGVGIAVGAAGTPVLAYLVGDADSIKNPIVLVEVAGLMAIMSLLATIGPALRALRVQPTEALRSE